MRGFEELCVTMHSCEHLFKHAHTCRKHEKNKTCPNSRTKASSLVLCCTAKLTLGMFVIVLPMKLHSNPFQLPPSLSRPPSSSSSSLPFQRNCSCSFGYVFHGPWWIHPVDRAKPFMHRKHSIPFQVEKERRWKGEGELGCGRWWWCRGWGRAKDGLGN